MSGTFRVKTLKGQIEILENIPVASTVRQLYQAVAAVETTPKGKWKLMLGVRTLKPSTDMDKILSSDFNIHPDEMYKIEVILDMGACHGKNADF